MATRFTIKDNFAAVQKRLDQFSDEVRTKVVASSLNRTMDAGRTDMVRSIAAEFNIRQSEVRDLLRVRRASSARGKKSLSATLLATGKRSANVIRFVERKVSLAQGRKRAKAGTRNQLHVKVLKSGQPKPIPGAFIGNKGRTVFQRVGKERLPIKPVQVINVRQMFNTKRINNPVTERMLSKFLVFFERDAKFYVAKFNGKA